MEIKISESQFRKLIKEDISSCNDELFKKLNNRYILNIFRKSIEAMSKYVVASTRGSFHFKS
jgi:hypothetical protein